MVNTRLPHHAFEAFAVVQSSSVNIKAVGRPQCPSFKSRSITITDSKETSK